VANKFETRKPPANLQQLCVNHSTVVRVRLCGGNAVCGVRYGTVSEYVLMWPDVLNFAVSCVFTLSLP